MLIYITIHWNLMSARLLSNSLYLILLGIDLPDQYNTIHCKLTNKSRVYNKWYHTYHNSLENLNQFNYKFRKTFYSVYFILILTLNVLLTLFLLYFE